MLPSEILRKVRQIEIRARGTVNSVLSGAYSSSFRGRGMEFAEVREYVPGDEIRTIDWNVTARQGHPFVKKFTEERELTVLLAVDASASGDFGTRQEMKGEIMATLSALLAFSAIQNNDRVGLLVFTETVERFIPPQKGRKHVLRVIRELLTHKPRATGTNLAGAIDHAARLLRQRAVVFLVSDFAAPDFEKPLRLLQRRHDAVAVKVTDRREHELPDAGFLELEDPETGAVTVLDSGSPVLRRAFAAKRRAEEERLQALFRRTGTDAIDIIAGRDYDETIRPLIHYFRKRAKHRG
jgi:uncharacterized protein (DUF58 family)